MATLEKMAESAKMDENAQKWKERNKELKMIKRTAKKAPQWIQNAKMPKSGTKEREKTYGNMLKP